MLLLILMFTFSLAFILSFQFIMIPNSINKLRSNLKKKKNIKFNFSSPLANPAGGTNIRETPGFLAKAKQKLITNLSLAKFKLFLGYFKTGFFI
jgi:hypothetical protein